MLTDRDVCMSAYIQRVPLTGASVTSAMSKEVYSCSPGDDVKAAEKVMSDKQVHRLLILDDDRRPVGLISLNDIAREGALENEKKAVRQVSDTEIASLLASVCAPRHRVIQLQAA